MSYYGINFNCFLPSRCVECSAKQTLTIDSTHKENQISNATDSGNNLFFKDQFLKIYFHTAKIQGTFRVNHIANDRPACYQYFLVKYNYGSKS